MCWRADSDGSSVWKSERSDHSPMSAQAVPWHANAKRLSADVAGRGRGRLHSSADPRVYAVAGDIKEAEFAAGPVETGRHEIKVRVASARRGDVDDRQCVSRGTRRHDGCCAPFWCGQY